WGTFLAASCRTAGQVNWPAAAYVAGLVLAVAWVREQFDTTHPRRKLVLGGLLAAVWLGLVLSVGSHYPGLVRPLLAAATGPPTRKCSAAGRSCTSGRRSPGRPTSSTGWNRPSGWSTRRTAFRSRSGRSGSATGSGGFPGPGPAGRVTE